MYVHARHRRGESKPTVRCVCGWCVSARAVCLLRIPYKRGYSLMCNHPLSHRTDAAKVCARVCLAVFPPWVGPRDTIPISSGTVCVPLGRRRRGKESCLAVIALRRFFTPPREKGKVSTFSRPQNANFGALCCLLFPLPAKPATTPLSAKHTHVHCNSSSYNTAKLSPMRRSCSSLVVAWSSLSLLLAAVRERDAFLSLAQLRHHDVPSFPNPSPEDLQHCSLLSTLSLTTLPLSFPWLCN